MINRGRHHNPEVKTQAQLLAEKIGTDLAWAATLPAPLASAGLADIELQGSLRPCRGATESADFDRLTLLSMADDLVGSGLLSRTEVDEALELYENPAFVDYSAGVIAAWGRRT
ncbi:MAG TPA: hypothetical protein VF423_09255 [Actinomycetes bacterium]